MYVYNKIAIWEYADMEVLVLVSENHKFFFPEFSLFVFVIFKAS